MEDRIRDADGFCPGGARPREGPAVRDPRKGGVLDGFRPRRKLDRSRKRRTVHPILLFEHWPTARTRALALAHLGAVRDRKDCPIYTRALSSATGRRILAGIEERFVSCFCIIPRLGRLAAGVVAAPDAVSAAGRALEAERISVDAGLVVGVAAVADHAVLRAGGLPPAPLHFHRPLAQHVAPSMQNGLPLTPGMSLGLQQLQICPTGHAG